VLPRKRQNCASLANRPPARCVWKPTTLQKFDRPTNSALSVKCAAPCSGDQRNIDRNSEATMGKSMKTAKPSTFGRMKASAVSASTLTSLLLTAICLYLVELRQWSAEQ